ncbi:MAG: hypothetical protein WB798_14100 [Nocardioidaceae bacterium]
MRLLGVELSRLLSRRAVVLLLLGAVLLTVLVTGLTAWSTRPVDDAGRAAARAELADRLAQPDVVRDLRLCREDPAQLLGPGATAQECERAVAPTLESYLARPELDLAEAIGAVHLPVTLMLLAILTVVGATFAGSDWSTRSMANQLLFEPRRTRVWTAKAVAVTLAAGLVTLVLLAGLWLTLSLVATSRGVETTAGVQDQIRWAVARASVLAAATTLGSYALTMLLRSTVATLGTLFAYVVGGEALLSVLPLDRPGRWSPSASVFAWLQDGLRLFDRDLGCPAGAPGCTGEYTVTLGHAAGYLAVLLAVTLTVSLVAFRRRDVP